MYEFTDKAVKFLNRKFVRMFSELKTLTSKDELHNLQVVKQVYDKAEDITEKMFVQIADSSYQYAENVFLSGKKRENDTKMNRKWVKGKLNAFNGVTGYVYLHEVERKTARTFEKIMSTTLIAAAVRKALKYWADMVKQYADIITDEAAIQAYEDYGVKKVVWVTEKDEKVCEECRNRDGKVYDIKKIPPKPHWGCRCRIIPKE